MKLCLLLLAHFVADFVFQNTGMAHNKTNKPKVLLKHCIIYSIAISAAVIFYGTVIQIILFAMSISLSHFIVDATRIRIQKRRLYTEKREFHRFIIDQSIHIAILIIASFFIPDRNSVGRAISDFYYTYFSVNIFVIAVITTAYVVCLNPTGVLIKKIFLRLGYQKFGNEEENMSGFLIGVLERICVLTLAMLSQFTAISFVIAAKSLARIKMLEDKDFAEKYLVGTLLSVVIALVCGVAVQKLLGFS